MLKAGDTPPEHLANSLYLSWFSEHSGEMIIESADYRLEISEPSWTYTAEELAERARLLAEQGNAPFAVSLDADGTIEEWDEFRCEQLLRESDFTTEQYGKLLEKYADHPDSERLIAEEMGWSQIEEISEIIPNIDADEENPTDKPWEEYAQPEPDPALEGIDWIRNERGDIIHPLHHQANKLLHTLLDETHEEPFDNPPLGDFRFSLMLLSAKLAGALNTIARNPDFLDRGMTIARLKRILEILNTTLTSVSTLGNTSHLPADRQSHYRTELFTLRESILTLITRLRGKD